MQFLFIYDIVTSLKRENLFLKFNNIEIRFIKKKKKLILKNLWLTLSDILVERFTCLMQEKACRFWGILYTHTIIVHVIRDFDVKDRFLFFRYRIYCIRCKNRRRKVSVNQCQYAIKSSLLILSQSHRDFSFFNTLFIPYDLLIYCKHRPIFTYLSPAVKYPESYRSIVSSIHDPNLLFTPQAYPVLEQREV